MNRSSFQVDGIDGVAGATASDDTRGDGSRPGDVTGAGIVQVGGAIGVDPAFNPSRSADPTNPDPNPGQPGGPVSLPDQRARALRDARRGLRGPDRLAAGPGISLFELDPSDGQLVFIAGNDNTLNPTQGTDWSIPLFTDSALTAGLTAGDYYVAVAGGVEYALSARGPAARQPRDLRSQSARQRPERLEHGPYVLNVLVQSAPKPPRVIASSPSPGQVLDQAPTQITVQFSEPIDIQQLAYQAFETSYQATLPQVFDRGSRRDDLLRARFLAYDPATNRRRSRCSTACRMASTSCTSRAREA